RRHLPRRSYHGKVPRHDQGADADRLVATIQLVVVIDRAERFATDEVACGIGVMAIGGDGVVHVDGGLGAYLAVVQARQLDQAFAPRREAIGDAVEYRAARGRIGPTPLDTGLFRRHQRRLHILGAAQWRRGDDGAGGRIHQLL